MRCDRRHREVEKSDDQRSPFEKDGDRILYTQAYLRLAGVTQVIWPQQQQKFHNRLTHTLKVTQVAKRIAQNILRETHEKKPPLDPEVVAAAAMAHDLGHPPFGHVAEKELDRLIRKDSADKEGFNGNAQSFRILTKLARRKPSFFGLNLTRATLAATLKYPWVDGTNQALQEGKFGAYRTEEEDFNFSREPEISAPLPSLEAQIMDYADDVTYSVHDLTDYMAADLVPINAIMGDPFILQEFLECWEGDEQGRWPKDKGGTPLAPTRMDPELIRVYLDSIYSNEHLVSRKMPSATIADNVSRMIHKLIIPATAAIGEGGKWVLRKQRVSEKTPKRPCDTVDNQIIFYKRLVWHFLICHARLATVQEGQRRVIRTLYNTYRDALSDTKNKKEWNAIIPGRLVPYLRELMQRDEQHQDSPCRLAADITCSFTDHEAYQMHWRLTGNRMPNISDLSIW